MTTFSLNLCPIVLTAPTCRQRQDELLEKIAAAPRNSVILASELCVSGYDFDGFFSGANRAMLGGSIGSFDAILFEALQEALSPDKFLGLTHLTSLNRAKGLAQISITQTQKNEIYNEFIMLNSQNVFYTQNKSKLFRPNLEHEIFASGDESAIKPFDFKGLKIGVLICFELRFAHLWQQLKGCDVILVPAMWGKAREDAYFTLCKALALANSCYVVAASSLDLEFSGVFLPSGEFAKEAKFDPNLILETKTKFGAFMTALEKSKCANMADEIGDILTLTPSLYKALCDTPREIFAPVTRHAYSLDAQPIGGNQWISSPLTVAKMTLALEAEDIDNALEIGCGSGYQAAILSHLAHRVFSVERIEKLASEAKKRFEALKIHNVHVRFDDGNVGWKSYAPYDRILLSAAAQQVPQTLFNQLKNGGILVAPIKKDGKQFIVKFTKDARGEITQKALDECLFVPLLGGIE